MTNTRTEILTEAAGLINNQREKDYGSPSINFSNIATGWEVILGVGVTAEQVSLCMAWLKIARIAGDGKASRDSFVDGAAYIALAAELSDDVE
jgi:hypothetical protein